MTSRRLALLALVLLTGACATKRDARDLQTELTGLRVRQDSIFDLLQVQNRAILDSLMQTTEQLLRVRGELTHQLGQLQQQLLQIQELTGQVQVRLNQFSNALENRTQQVTGEPAPEGAGGAGDAEQLYSIGVQQLQRGNASTARRAFEGVVERFPTHARAPDAQFQLGETYYVEREYSRALQELEKVVQMFPDSPRAPMALYRAGVIAEERGNIDRAREYFQRVIAAYPTSDARDPAEAALRRLRG